MLNSISPGSCVCYRSHLFHLFHSFISYFHNRTTLTLQFLFPLNPNLNDPFFRYLLPIPHTFGIQDSMRLFSFNKTWPLHPPCQVSLLNLGLNLLLLNSFHSVDAFIPCANLRVLDSLILLNVPITAWFISSCFF